MTLHCLDRSLTSFDWFLNYFSPSSVLFLTTSYLAPIIINTNLNIEVDILQFNKNNKNKKSMPLYIINELFINNIIARNNESEILTTDDKITKSEKTLTSTYLRVIEECSVFSEIGFVVFFQNKFILDSFVINELKAEQDLESLNSINKNLNYKLKNSIVNFYYLSNLDFNQKSNRLKIK